MKRVLKPICANARVTDEETVLTSRDVLCLLQAIDELQGLEIKVAETGNGAIQFVIGNCCYEVSKMNTGCRV